MKRRRRVPGLRDLGHDLRLERTPRGLRLIDGRDVLSEALASPGPTHGLWDVLAACVVGLGRGPRFAMLGFAAGSVLAPLRALGFAHPVHAVDLSRAAEPLFREVCGAWAGEVHLDEGDAADWLRATRRRFDVVLEDLTLPAPRGAVKPFASLDELPHLVAARLAPRGVAIVNALSYPGLSWPELFRRLAGPHRTACIVECHDFENRLLLAGPGMPPAREAAARVRSVLRRLGSQQEKRVALHAWQAGA